MMFLSKPKYFLNMLAGNVDNPNLTDFDFRELVKTSLAITDWPEREEYVNKLEEKT